MRTTGVAYALLTLGSSTLWGFISGWLLYFYLPPAGSGSPLVPLASYGGVLFASRVINILAGFPIGYLSDQARTRWGRRIPFIFSGALALPALFVLLWMPPAAGASPLNLGYLAAVLVAFNLAYEIFQTPYDALLPELITEDQQRVRVSGLRAGFQLVGMVLAAFAGPLIEAVGFQTAAVVFAAAVLPVIVAPLFLLRENPQPLEVGSDRLTFRAGLITTLNNRSFQVFTTAWALFWIATTFILETIPYIVTQVCKLSEADTVYFFLPAILASLLCFPLVTWLASRYGKARIFGISLLAGAVVLPGLALIDERLPVPLIAQGILWIVLQAVALSGAQVLPTAIAAEITDLDEVRTGQRRQGSFYAFWGVLDQLASGLASGVLPLFLLLGSSRADPLGPLGIRILGVFGGLLLLGAFLVFQRYPDIVRRIERESQGFSQAENRTIQSV